MEKIKELFDFIPELYFVKNLRENKVGHIKLAFLRETTAPMVIRSTDPAATIIFETADGRELIEIPPRKLKSREKLLGLMICRKFGVVEQEERDDKGKVTKPGVRYNSIFSRNHLANPNSVLFGDSVTQSGDSAALPSKVVYDWAYSLRDVSENRLDKLQHNSCNEEGSIIKVKDIDQKKPDNGDVAPQALHETEYVMPETLFPHFLTVDNVTPELFFHLLSCVLHQHRYGAMTNLNGDNMTNHLVGVAFSDFEKPINSFLISKKWPEERKAKEDDAAKSQERKADDGGNETSIAILPTVKNVSELMQRELKGLYKSGCLDSEKVADLFVWVNKMWEEHPDEVKAIYETAKADCETYLQDLKIWKTPSVGSGKASKGKGGAKKTDQSEKDQADLFNDNETNGEDEDFPTPD